MTSQLDNPPVAELATNGEQTQQSLPKTTSKPSRGKLLLIGGLVLAAVAAVVTVGAARMNRPTRVDLVTHTVKYDRLELSVVERGALESSDNHDIYCRVKSGAKNSTVASTIKSVIDDGSVVLKDRPKDQCGTMISWDHEHAMFIEKLGDPNRPRVFEVHDDHNSGARYADVLVELDDSGLQEQLKAKKIELDTANAAKIKAEEDYEIMVSTTTTALALAKIDLQNYEEGAYPQALKDAEGKIKVAESDVEQQRERAAWSDRMVKKGFQTVSQAQAERSKLESLEISLASAVEARRVLTDPVFGTRKSEVTKRKNTLIVAEKNAIGQEIQAKTEREKCRSLYLQQKTQYDDIIGEIKKCVIYAPQDGMVVYYIPEQARFGGGSQQSIVAQGEPVREGQKLMQIPDLGHMLVNTKVHEALVTRVKQGQYAKVRVDAFPDRNYDGHIDSVATISSQQDWMSADVKVYTTKIAIDEIVQGLKPGMSAEVTITVGDALERVLTVPVEAIVGSVEMGGKRRCYVLNGTDPEPRDIVIGMSNDRVVEVREGLKEGEEVVLNPKRVLGDQIPTRKNGSDPSKSSSAPKKNGGGSSAPSKDKSAGAKSPGGQPAAGRPSGGPGGQGGQGGFQQLSPEEQQKRRQEMIDNFKKASPEERKKMLEQIPEDFRGRVRDMLKSQGIDVN
jgi:multidrug resistance efflux pump